MNTVNILLALQVFLFYKLQALQSTLFLCDNSYRPNFLGNTLGEPTDPPTHLCFPKWPTNSGSWPKYQETFCEMARNSSTDARNVRSLARRFPLVTYIMLTMCLADKREFIKISQAVGMGFVVMGVIGYVVKLSTLFLTRVFR